MGLLPFGRNMKRVKQGKPFLIMQTKLPKDLCVSHTHLVLRMKGNGRNLLVPLVFLASCRE